MKKEQNKYFQPLIGLIFLYISFLSHFFSVLGQDLVPNLQLKISNGKELFMLNDSVGFAAVSGAGTELSGGIYKLEKGNWKTLFTFPYSDDPQLKVFSPNSVFMLHHLTHFGNWKYVLYHFDGKDWNRIDVPLIHWDETDFVIIKDIDGINENNLWLVGQKAAILHYSNKKWTVLKTPVQWNEKDQVFAKDFRAVKCLDERRTLVVGNGGTIIEYNGEIPKLIVSPVKENWNRIVRLNESSVLLSSDQGSIFKWDGKIFTRIKSPETDKLIAGLQVDENGIIHIFQNGNMFRLENDSTWRSILNLKDSGISLYDFSLTDLSGKNLKNISFIGSDGIYKTNLKGVVNFRDVSRESGISSRARSAQFFDANNDGYQDIFLQGEFTQPDGLLLNNGNGVFSDYSFQSHLLTSSNGSLSVCIGDIDNDDDQDLITLDIKDLKFRVFRNQGNAVFNDITEWSGLQELTSKSFQELWGNSMQLRDLDFDGDLDLVITIWEKGILVFENNGIGKFSRQENLLSEKSQKFNDKRIMGIGLTTNSETKMNTIFVPYNIDSSWVYQYSGNLDSVRSIKNLKLKEYTGSKSSIFIPSKNSTFSDIYISDKNETPIIGKWDGDSYKYSVLPITNYSPESIKGYANAVLESADFDLNSEPDILFQRHLYLQENGRFTDVMESNGILNEGYISSGDADSDGDYDVLLAQGSEFGNKPLTLYRNQLNSANYIKVALKGITSNSGGIGSRIEIYPNGITEKDSLLGFWNYGDGVSPGASYPTSPITLATLKHNYVSVKVIFPSGEIRIINNIAAKSTIVIAEYPEPIATIYIFGNAVTKLFKYLIWWQEILKLIFHISLAVFIFRSIKDSTLKNIYRNPIWWILAVLVYLFVFYATAQLEWWKNLFFPTLVSLVSVFGGIFVLYFYSVYVRTNYIGPYKIEKLLGEGSAGKVFLVNSSSEKKNVAVKIYHERIFETKEGQIRFQREVAIGTTLKHPNIVNILGSGTHGKSGFIVMEYVEGENLRNFLTKEISVNQILTWGIEIAHALSYIHQNGMLHRDIKTENIMVMPDNHIKVMDLGLAKTNIFQTMTNMGTSVGTLAYMSPQQSVGMPLDITSDLYSLGVVMYELLTSGTLPVTGEHDMAFVYNIFNQKPEKPSKYNDQINEELDRIILKCIEKQTEDRYQTEAELIADLEKWKSWKKEG